MASRLYTRRLRGPNHHVQIIFVVLLTCSAIFCHLAAAVAGRLLQEPSGFYRRRDGIDDEVLAALSSPRRKSARSLINIAQPGLASTYMDSLLADPAAARITLAGNFQKRSNVAVVYMCFERMDMINRALPAILRSDGLADFDLFISQDGGAASTISDEIFSFSNGTDYAYIRHTANLCAGLHHYFVKAFAFDIMGYDILLVVEEDNVIHPQALQLLRRMAELSVTEPEIGIVSLLDMDMSAFLDASNYAAGLIRTIGHVGHLWVFGVHRSKYDMVRGCLRDYYEVIKGHDYRMKHEPPLRDAIEGLMRKSGIEDVSVLSQDRWFINSLAKFGFTKRYQTLFRFLLPIGYHGLHFTFNQSQFFGLFGREMYSGRVDLTAVFDVTKNPADTAAIKATVRARLTDLCKKYWGGMPPPDSLVDEFYIGVMDGRLNGLEAVHDVMRGPKSPLPPLGQVEVNST